MIVIKRSVKGIVLGGLMSAAASVSASPLFVEKPREVMPAFVMPTNVTVENDQSKVLDTDPRSRTALIHRIQAHEGFQWTDFDAANRFHIEFDTGSHKVALYKQTELKAFMDQGEGKDRVIVIGFADSQGDYEVNKDLALERAKAVAQAIKKDNKGVEIQILSSVAWPGDPDKARRVDVLYY